MVATTKTNWNGTTSTKPENTAKNTRIWWGGAQGVELVNKSASLINEHIGNPGTIIIFYSAMYLYLAQFYTVIPHEQQDDFPVLSALFGSRQVEVEGSTGKQTFYDVARTPPNKDNIVLWKLYQELKRLIDGSVSKLSIAGKISTEELAGNMSEDDIKKGMTSSPEGTQGEIGTGCFVLYKMIEYMKDSGLSRCRVQAIREYKYQKDVRLIKSKISWAQAWGTVSIIFLGKSCCSLETSPALSRQSPVIPIA